MSRKSQNRRMKFKLPPAVISIVVAVAMAVLSAPAFAALPAPNWLPGQPILAGNQIIAMWMPIPGAVKYVVYLDGKKIAEGPANQYMGLAPTAGGDHEYQVVAVDASGAEGPKSVSGIVKIVVLEPPGNLVSRPDPGGNAVHLRWRASKGSIISNLYRAESKDGPFKLLQSIQGDNYKDTGLEYGKGYWYAVSAKDVSGKESGRSAAVMVKMAKPQAKAEALKLDLTIVPSTEVGKQIFIGPVAVNDMMDVKYTPSGEFWITTGDQGTVVVVNPDLQTSRTIDVGAKIREKGGDWHTSYRIAVLEGDKFVVTDNFSSQVACFTTTGEFLWVKKPPLPPDDRDDIWPFLKESAKKIRMIPNAPMFLDDNTLWVSEARAPLVYIMDPETGETLDWFSGYSDADGKKIQSGGIAFLFKVNDTDVWAGEALLHRVVAFDPETRVVKFIVGAAHDGFIGGFLGLNDAVAIPKDGNVLLADAGIGTLQAFSPTEGKYQYHIGGEKPEPDPELGNERPKMDVGAMNSIFFDNQGRLWAEHGLQKYFSVREVNWDGKKAFKKE